jgi:Ca2+-binding RTX toxin-like protein
MVAKGKIMCGTCARLSSYSADCVYEGSANSAQNDMTFQGEPDESALPPAPENVESLLLELRDSDSHHSGAKFARFESVAIDNVYVSEGSQEPASPIAAKVPSTMAAGFLPEPLQSINWGYTAPSTINVFFASSGVTVNDGYSDNPTFTTSAWSATEIAAANSAFQNFENVANVTINVVNNIAAANFVMFESANATTDLGYWGVGGGTLTYSGTNYILDGWGVFNANDPSWSTPSLAMGGYGYVTLIHEIGHGMGLAHPHDNGGTSSVMNGVTGPFGSYGTTGLNQGLWTTMSYNDGFHSQNGDMPVTQGYGWQGSLMTLDIAVLQQTYGARAFNAGANIYTMPQVNAAGTYYQAIWDTGGTDTIRHTGSAASTINLNAASLANSNVGGGFLSSVVGIKGGFTIANGVVIENAIGGSGADTIIGNSVANTLDGGLGIDRLYGGGGADLFYVNHAGDNVYESVGAGADRVLTSVSYVLTLGQEIETLTTTNALGLGAINLTGNAFANVLGGNAGANTLNGGVGIDRLLGYGGADTYYVDNAADLVFEAAGAGSDRVLSSVSYVLAAGQEMEALTTTNALGLGAINLTGNAFANVIAGNAGANILSGGTGIDQHFGYGGADTYYVDNAADAVFEAVGAGADRVLSSVSYVLTAGQEVETLTTTNALGFGAINFTGNAFANVLAGNGATNILNGGAGADRLFGYGGGDFYYVDNAADSVYESAGGGADRVFASVSYVLTAGQEVETLTTTNANGLGAINFTGNAIDNTIGANAGANIINGSLGNDVLYGYGGNDIFVFDTALNAATNRDTIADFNAAADTIRLENTVFALLTATGTLALNLFKNLSLAVQDPDDVILYNDTTGALFYDSNGLALGGQTQFAALTGSPTVTNLDFVVI